MNTVLEIDLGSTTMDTLHLPSFANARTTISAVFLAGFAVCTRGIGQAPVHGWLHPVSILGYIFGGLALLLGFSVLFRVRVTPITSDSAALVVLLRIIVVEAVLAFFNAL
jgi:hypothetical protein